MSDFFSFFLILGSLYNGLAQGPASWPSGPSAVPTACCLLQLGWLTSLRNDGLFLFFPQALLKTPNFSRCQISVVCNSPCPLNKTTGPKRQGFVFGKGVWFELVHQRWVDGVRVILETINSQAQTAPLPTPPESVREQFTRNGI